MVASQMIRTAPFGAVASSRSPSFVASLVMMLAKWNDARVTRSALGKLTDRELDDIGLTRSDIDTISATR